MSNYKKTAEIVSIILGKKVSILEFHDGSQSILINGQLFGRVRGGSKSKDTVKQAYYELHHLCRGSLIIR